MEFKCDISVDEANMLQGSMSFGLPAVYTHAEYPDGLADPILMESDNVAWLTTQVGGPANHPQDDSDILEARAAEARKSRPERIPFDRIDVDSLVEQMRSSKELQDRRDPDAQKNIDLDQRNRDNPFETEQERKEKTQLPTIDSGMDELTPLSRSKAARWIAGIQSCAAHGGPAWWDTCSGLWLRPSV